MSNAQILIIEDEQDIAHLIAFHLHDLHIQTRCCHDGESGLAAALAERWDLIILDLRLPKMDGLEVCRRIRAALAYVPILMLTAKTTELDRVLGLEIGADDYMTKPFSILELMARVKAHLRRSSQQVAAPNDLGAEYVLGDLLIQVDEHRVSLNDKVIDLTAREFDLLVFFAAHPGRVYHRMQLLDQIWGYGHDGYEHTVNSHINRLRAKIEPNPSDPVFIMTVWGVGYKMSESWVKASA